MQCKWQMTGPVKAMIRVRSKGETVSERTGHAKMALAVCFHTLGMEIRSDAGNVDIGGDI